jgi:type IV pilus assembly protein PilM
MSAVSGPSRSWLASPPPAVALDISAARVTALWLVDQASTRLVSGYATEPLPPGAVDTSLNAPNVHDRAALADTIRTAIQKLGQRARRVALVLPDSVAKVSLVRFDKVPPKPQDLDQLVRWQVRKSAPFRIDDAQVAAVPGVAVPPAGREYIVTVIRRDIVESYERACEAAGVHAGIIDIASFNQINAVLAGEPIAGDWLLVHVAADYATLAVVRDDTIVSFRNRSAAGEAELADLVHQTAMYHEDRLGGGGFTRIVLAGASVLGAENIERLRRGIQERIASPVELLDFRSAATMRDRISAGPDLLDALAPALGILVRERVLQRGPRAGQAGRVA